MRIGMNQSEVDAFVAKLKDGADLKALERASGVEPAWHEANRGALLKLAGVDDGGGEDGDGTPDGAPLPPAASGDGAETQAAAAPKRRGRPPKAPKAVPPEPTKPTE
jgi:hypothetical protein